jgi:hypothetical protein
MVAKGESCLPKPSSKEHTITDDYDDDNDGDDDDDDDDDGDGDEGEDLDKEARLRRHGGQRKSCSFFPAFPIQQHGCAETDPEFQILIAAVVRSKGEGGKGKTWSVVVRGIG